MRFFAPLLALFATATLAQQNAINVPLGGFQIKANTPVTITWTNPSSGTVTIKLQQGSGITPDSGLVVASFVQAASETATFIIPGNQVNTAQYNFEIIDDTNPYNINFSPGFTISGATGTGVMTAATLSATASITATQSGSTLSAATLSTASLYSISSISVSTYSILTVSSSETITSDATPTSSSSFSYETTSAPVTNSAGTLQLHGGFLAVLLAALALF